MPLAIIALLCAVICVAAVTVWLFTLGGSGGLLVLPIIFLVAAVAFRTQNK